MGINHDTRVSTTGYMQLDLDSALDTETKPLHATCHYAAMRSCRHAAMPSCRRIIMPSPHNACSDGDSRSTLFPMPSLPSSSSRSQLTRFDPRRHAVISPCHRSRSSEQEIIKPPTRRVLRSAIGTCVRVRRCRWSPELAHGLFLLQIPDRLPPRTSFRRGFRRCPVLAHRGETGRPEIIERRSAPRLGLSLPLSRSRRSRAGRSDRCGGGVRWRGGSEGWSRTQDGVGQRRTGKRRARERGT